MASTFDQRGRGALILVAALLWASMVLPSAGRAASPREIVLVRPETADKANCAAWKKEGFAALALVLDDQTESATLRKAAASAASSSLEVYLWIEVGRNPALARAHPDWVAALGSHGDWQARFPKIQPPVPGEVAKAWPWVPIGYKEAFDAHLARIKKLLERAPDGYQGVLLNDLQGGPASCGCGNLQCRWALDYRVGSTTTKLAEADAAPRFVREVGKIAKGKMVIPVWVTECEREDLPASLREKGSWGTGYCGSVPCFETCRKHFAEQWTALQAGRDGPTALLTLHREFQRDRQEYGGTAGWVARAVEYCDKQMTVPIPHERLWLVVQGYDLRPEEESKVRAAAAKAGLGAVVVARTPIDQSYEPRVTKVE
jgi:hypothetical protein